jgi:hypothetical protein
MTSPAPDVGSVSAAPSRFVRALPWCVLAAALVTLAPLAQLDVLILVVHLPTFVVLLAYAISLAGHARKGQIVSPVAVAGVLGGLGASVALMGFLAVGMLEDGTVGFFYFSTWMLLPILALVGSGLAAAVVGLGQRVFRRRSKA